MKLTTILGLAAALGAGAVLRAADEPPPAQPPQKPNRTEFRQSLENLTPEQRQARIREFRERQGLGPFRPEMERRREELQKLSPEEREIKLKEWRERGGPLREEMEKRREELKGLSAEEREIKIKEWRDKGIGDRPGFAAVSPEEREARRKVLRERLEKQIADLKKKKSAGGLDDEEKQRLERMLEIAQRFEQGAGPFRPPDGPRDLAPQPLGERREK